MQTMLESVQSWCIFKYRDFILSPHEAKRLASALRSLEQGDNPKVSRGRKHERRWIMSDVVHRLIRALLLDALNNGAICWDAVIMKALGILTQAVLCTRAVDIRRSKYYSGNECLCWGHIFVRHDDATGLLGATIELCFKKSSK